MGAMEGVESSSSEVEVMAKVATGVLPFCTILLWKCQIFCRRPLFLLT